MAAEFIGLQMTVTLRGPDPPMKLRGTVCAVEAGISLTLKNVWILNTKQWKPQVEISAVEIADLVEESMVLTAPPAVSQIPVPTPPIVSVPAPAVQQTPAFVDPAILSVGKPAAAPAARLPEICPQPNTSEKRDPNPPMVVPLTQVHGVVAEALKGLKIESRTAAVESADEVLIAGVAEEEDQEATLEYGQVSTAQRKKRPQRKANRSTRGGGGAQDEAVEAVPAHNTTKQAGRGKGWRQTPMLQSTSSFQPFNSLKRGTKGRPANANNGWASEDVTDVQEAGDFDFEQELAKFDKQNVFEQLRKDDQIDEADRLVSHNRVPKPKPGTAGGKNLHYSENVLDMQTTPTILKPMRDRLKESTNDYWNSEADDAALNGNERLSGRDNGGMGSRQGSRRGDSKVSTNRRSQSRKASAVPLQPGSSKVNSGVSHYRTSSLKSSRPSSRLSARAAAAAATTAADKRKQLSTSAASATQQGLYVMPSNRRIETISALQMLNLENIAHNEIGLTEEMMTENAGRGIAEVTLAALSEPAIKVRQAGNVDPSTGIPPPPTIVVLAGNNTSGSRAVAAARHLRNKGINVLVCVVGLERGERDLLEDVKQQVRLYKNLHGRVFHKSDFFEHIRKISIPMLTIDTPRTSLSSLANPAPVMLIVDALLGLAISFEELRSGDQATVYELIEWANRNEAFKLSVDVPTGIDPSSGAVSVVDGNRLYVKPRYVVAIGAPKKGLLEVMVAADNEGDDDTAVVNSDLASLAPDDLASEWKLFLIDTGLGPAVWKKAGTRMRKGVDFEGKWVLQLKYKGLLSSDDGEDGDEEENVDV